MRKGTLTVCWALFGLLPAALAGQVVAPVMPDSVPNFRFEAVVIEARAETRAQQRALAREQEKVDRLRYNVYRVYPLAREAAAVVNRINREMIAQGTRKDQKKYIERLEKELFQKYEKRLRKLSLSQGKILIKLIDRETGQSAYSLIKDLRSGTKAFMWQMLARLFGSNLKWEYDPEQEYAIEQIVQGIETGEDPLYPVYAAWFAQRDATP